MFRCRSLGDWRVSTPEVATAALDDSSQHHTSPSAWSSVLVPNCDLERLPDEVLVQIFVFIPDLLSVIHLGTSSRILHRVYSGSFDVYRHLVFLANSFCGQYSCSIDRWSHPLLGGPHRPEAVRITREGSLFCVSFDCLNLVESGYMCNEPHYEPYKYDGIGFVPIWKAFVPPEEECRNSSSLLTKTDSIWCRVNVTTDDPEHVAVGNAKFEVLLNLRSPTGDLCNTETLELSCDEYQKLHWNAECVLMEMRPVDARRKEWGLSASGSPRVRMQDCAGSESRREWKMRRIEEMRTGGGRKGSVLDPDEVVWAVCQGSPRVPVVGLNPKSLRCVAGIEMDQEGKVQKHAAFFPSASSSDKETPSSVALSVGENLVQIYSLDSGDLLSSFVPGHPSQRSSLYPCRKNRMILRSSMIESRENSIHLFDLEGTHLREFGPGDRTRKIAFTSALFLDEMRGKLVIGASLEGSLSPSRVSLFCWDSEREDVVRSVQIGDSWARIPQLLRIDQDSFASIESYRCIGIWDSHNFTKVSEIETLDRHRWNCAVASENLILCAQGNAVSDNSNVGTADVLVWDLRRLDKVVERFSAHCEGWIESMVKCGCGFVSLAAERALTPRQASLGWRHGDCWTLSCWEIGKVRAIRRVVEHDVSALFH